MNVVNCLRLAGFVHLLILYSILPLTPLVCYILSKPLFETLTRSNYKKWRRRIELDLALTDLDMCVLEGKPTVSVDDSSTGSKMKLKKQEYRIN